MSTLDDLMDTVADKFEQAVERVRDEIRLDLEARGLDEEEITDELENWESRFDLYLRRALAEARIIGPKEPGEGERETQH